MLVSVVIPSHNSARFIRATLDSVLAQTHTDLEIVIVDDGSTDSSVDILEEYRQKDDRVVVYRQPNQGSASARNLGIAKSTGELIAFLDADDLWHPTKIEKQHNLFLDSPDDVGLIYVYTQMIDVDGKLDGFSGACTFKKGYAFHYMLYDNFVGNGSTAMVRRNCLPQPEPFDVAQKGNDDYYFYLRIASKYKVDAVPEKLVGYRWNTGQNKSSNLDRQIESRSSMMKKIERDNPGIPKKVLRWSRAAFFLSHAQTLFKKRAYSDALKIFIAEVACTPSFILSPPFRRLLLLVVKVSFRKITRASPERAPYLLW